MKKKSKIILIFIIFILIIISILIFMLFKYNKEKIDINDNKSIISNKSIRFIRTSDTNLYYTIDECIKSYFTMIKNNQSEVLISYLNPDYINKNKITVENVLTIVEKYNNYDTYRTSEMYEIENGEYFLYYAKGRIDRNNVYFSVGLDKNKETFEIIPIDEKEYLTRVEENYTTLVANEISKRKYNFIRYKGFNDKDIARLYFIDYIKLMLIDPEEAYNMLEDNYKKEKFKSLKNFEDYINENKQKLQASYKVETADSTEYESFSKYYDFKKKYEDYALSDYSVKDNSNTKQYICEDGKNNYYIFNVKHPGDYTVKLDKE